MPTSQSKLFLLSPTLIQLSPNVIYLLLLLLQSNKISILQPLWFFKNIDEMGSLSYLNPCDCTKIRLKQLSMAHKALPCKREYCPSMPILQYHLMFCLSSLTVLSPSWPFSFLNTSNSFPAARPFICFFLDCLYWCPYTSYLPHTYCTNSLSNSHL